MDFDRISILNMEETYEDIVKRWYVRMKGDFTRMLMDRYKNTNIRLADAENIYQDIFVAIHKNMEEGRLRYENDWDRYIITVGLNMASKRYRKSNRTDSLDEIFDADMHEKLLQAKKERINSILKELPDVPGDEELYEDQEAKLLLGDELLHTPEPCASIIRLSYYGDMTDSEISEVVEPYCSNGKNPETNAKAIKARRWLCMRDLIFRVKMALYNAGIINEKPIKKSRNGRKQN